jgi:hypothetical protein
VAQEHRGAGRSLGDIHHRDVQQLLKPLAAVLAVAGLDDGVERFRIVDHRVHDGDGGEVAFEVAFAGVGAEARRDADDLGAGCCDAARAWAAMESVMDPGGVHVCDEVCAWSSSQRQCPSSAG